VGACITIIGASVTGVVMWWKRKPQGAWGLPKSSKLKRRPPVWVSATILSLGVLMPTTGVSLIAVLALERLWALRPLKVVQQPELEKAA